MLLVELTGTPLNSALIAFPSAASLNIVAVPCSLHRLSWPDPGGVRLRDVKIIRGNSIADNFCQDRRVTLSGELQIFQGENSCPFAQNHSGAMSIKRTAFLRR